MKAGCAKQGMVLGQGKGGFVPYIPLVIDVRHFSALTEVNEISLHAVIAGEGAISV